MKKRLTILFIIAIIALATACGSEPITEDDPITVPEFYMDSSSNFGLDTVAESDYSNITATAEYETYKKDVDVIKIFLTNHNVGKGFYFYSTPALQKETNGYWKNVDFTERHPNWYFAALEGNKTEPNIGVVAISPVYNKVNLSKGNYRAAVFVKDHVLYAYFKVE